MLKLHVGSGKRNFGKNWVHIDGGDYDHLDIKTNDLFNLPFEDDSVDLIYASHVISYYDREEVVILLKHWYKLLKNNGILRLAVPDFRVMALLYSNTMEFLDWDLPITELDDILGPMYGKMQMGDKFIYHKTVYDYMSLAKLLRDVGFSNVKHYNWRKTEHVDYDDHSQAYLPKMDKENGVLVSLNVEATK